MATDEKADAPFVDPEEQELLLRYRHDNPTFLCFKDTDERVRMLEERFAECEMEKQVKAVHELMLKRRHELSKDHRLQRLPLHPTVPTAKELRDLRNAIVGQYEQVVEHEAPVVLADALVKEIALSEEAREGLPATLATLTSFFKRRVEMLPRRQLRYARRWMAFCEGGEAQIALHSAFVKSRVEFLAADAVFARDALEQVSAYMRQLESNAKAEGRARRATTKLDATALAIEELGAVALRPLDPNYIRTFLRAQSYEFRTRKRFERFASKCQFMPLSHRYQLYSDAMEHLIGGAVAEGAERCDLVPTMIVDEEGVISKLDDVAGCFRLAGHDKSDVQEFVYNANKRYAAVFAAQAGAMVFHAMEVHTTATTAGGKPAPREVVDDSSEKVFLRQTQWESACTLSIEPPTWQRAQDALIDGAVGSVNPLLHAEMEFLAETDVAKTIHRWRTRADSHDERAHVRSRLENVDIPTMRAEYAGEAQHGLPGGAKRRDVKSSSAHQQRLLALYQLRYIRVRSFRRRLLALLNYFASTFRAVALDCRPRALAHDATGLSVEVAPLIPNARIAAELEATTPAVQMSDPVASAPTTTFANRLLAMYDAVEERMRVPAANAESSAASPATQGAPPSSNGNSGAEGTISEWCTINTPDSYEAATGNATLQVRDAAGRLVMDEWAVRRLERVEHEMLRTASFYLAKFADANHKNADAADVDYETVLEDVYESELLFHEGLAKTLDSYREAYEHAVDRAEQTKLARVILSVIHQRPRLDLSDAYFTTSYTNEIINLELQHTLLREIINAQVQDERKVLAAWPAAPDEASALDGSWFGGPEPAIADTRLFHSLFPNTSVINVMDIYSSTAVVADVPQLLEQITSTIAARFCISHAAGVHRLRKHALQEMLVQWRLLGEEEKVLRQLQQAPQGEDLENQAAFNSVATIDTVIHEMCAEEGSSSGARGGAGAFATTFSSSSPSAAANAATGSNSQSPTSIASASAAAADAAADRSVPEPGAVFTKLSRVLDLYSVRAALMSALYETEILYNVHRQQAKAMGVSVRRTQLEAIDFETRRTYAEIDEADNLRDAAGGVSNGSDGIEEVLSVKAELLSNLAIAEFEQAMARFDLTTTTGLRKLLSHMFGDFRRALTAQLTQKNMLVAVTLCNQVSIDLYYESLMFQRWSNSGKSSSFVTQSVGGMATSPTRSSASGHDGAAGDSLPQHVRRRLEQWPSLREQNDFIDRASLQKLYISVNQIKSVHRKCILLEMNNRTADVLNTKKPELLRRKIKELKAELVHEYCLNVAFATYQYAVRYQACCAAHHLRLLSAQHPHLNFFTIGNRSDIIRPQTRSNAVAGETRRVATCMLTRGARMDDPRYVPHPIQLLQMDYDVKERAGAAGGGASAIAGTGSGGAAAKGDLRPHDHQHIHNQSHLRTNHCLVLILRVLHHWSGIIALLRTSAQAKHPSLAVLQSPTTVGFDAWREALVHINGELENLADTTDVDAVVEYLEMRHTALFLTLTCALNAVQSHYRRQGMPTPATDAQRAVERLRGWATHSIPVAGRRTNHSWPMIAEFQAAIATRSSDARHELTPFYGPIGRIKTMKIGVDFDASVTECENTPSGALPLGPREHHFYEELERHPWAFIGDEWRHPYANALEGFMLASTTEERGQLASELARVDKLLEDSSDEVYESFGRENVREGGSLPTRLTPAHLEVLVATTRREQLKQLYTMLLRHSLSAGASSLRVPTGPMRPGYNAPGGGKGGASDAGAGAGGAGSNLDSYAEELFQRAVIHRARTLVEREQSERNDAARRRRGRGQERDLRRRQVLVAVMEINKLLIQLQLPPLERVRGALELADAQMEADTVQTNTVLPQKTAIFTDFISILMARALCTRNEGDKAPTYHIPEGSLNAAIDTVARRLEQLGAEERLAMANATETLLQQHQRRVVAVERRCAHLEFLLSVEQRAVQRRVLAGVADSTFDLLFVNEMLEKDTAALQRQLNHVETAVRNDVRLEFDGRIAELQRQLLLAQGQYASYRKKLHRDMQVSLEEIKRVAMLSVGKMENAPLHIKRQALKIAISDDEVNSLKEQNNELKQAVAKTKLWYEMKLLRMKAAYEKQLQVATSAADETRAKFWGSKQLTESEIAALREQLTTTQNLLSQSELEVEMLRRDLQLQLTNKKDLVAWKVQQAKVMEDLQKKVRRYERWGQYDIDKLLAEHERRVAAGGAESGGGTGSGGNLSARGRSASGHRPGTGGSDGQSGGGGGAASAADLHALRQQTEEIRRLQERLEKEKRLKEKAFAKVDELRQGDPATNEALVWQRKYFEAASELQRCIKELETTRAGLAAGNTTGTSASAGAPGGLGGAGTASSLLRPFHSAGPSAAATTPSVSPAPGTPEVPLAGSAVGGSRPTTTATPIRPPPSRLGSDLAKRGAQMASRAGSGLKK